MCIGNVHKLNTQGARGTDGEKGDPGEPGSMGLPGKNVCELTKKKGNFKYNNIS